MTKVAKLFKYKYTSPVLCTNEIFIEYVLLYVPISASFNDNRSTLIDNKHFNDLHEIDIASITDLTINL